MNTDRSDRTEPDTSTPTYRKLVITGICDMCGATSNNIEKDGWWIWDDDELLCPECNHQRQIDCYNATLQ